MLYIIVIAIKILKDFHYCCVQVRAKAYLLYTAWQRAAVWDTINSDLQSEGDPHSATRKSIFQLTDIITNCNSCTNDSSHCWLQICSRHALFPFSAQGLSKVRNHRWKFLPSLLLCFVVLMETANTLPPS